ncbi:MAG: bile acid:sodium symporter [Deltaproteobacteria bacterium]|nr:bile acid:sodium symporter [Deltaproteobacteria bacterium]
MRRRGACGILFKKILFFVGIAVVVKIAFTFPAVKVFVKPHNILTIVILLGFLTTGLTLETASIGEQFKNIRVLSAALISSLLLFPAIAYFLARLVFDAPPDSAIGALIIGAAQRFQERMASDHTSASANTIRC